MIAELTNQTARLRELCEKFDVERLEVFGSAVADDGFDAANSDLDFIVDFRAGADLGPWLRRYFELRSAIAELFGRSVDLVMASAMKDPHFVREAARTRRVLYAR